MVPVAGHHADLPAALKGITASGLFIFIRAGLPAPSRRGAGPCHGAVARLYVAVVHAGRGCRTASAARPNLSRPAFCGGMLPLPVSAFFAEGHYNSNYVELSTLVLCTLWLGCASLAGWPARRVVFWRAPWPPTTGCRLLCGGLMGCARWCWGRHSGAGTAGWRIAARNCRAFCGVLCSADPRAVERSGAGIRAICWSTRPASRAGRGWCCFRGMRFEHAVNPLPRYYLVWMMLVTPAPVGDAAGGGGGPACPRVAAAAPPPRDPVDSCPDLPPA